MPKCGGKRTEPGYINNTCDWANTVAACSLEWWGSPSLPPSLSARHTSRIPSIDIRTGAAATSWFWVPRTLSFSPNCEFTSFLTTLACCRGGDPGLKLIFLTLSFDYGFGWIAMVVYLKVMWVVDTLVSVSSSSISCFSWNLIFFFLNLFFLVFLDNFNVLISKIYFSQNKKNIYYFDAFLN